MSATKQLRKALPKLSPEQIAGLRVRLEAAKATERNPMIRSSYWQQLEIIKEWLSRPAAQPRR